MDQKPGAAAPSKAASSPTWGARIFWVLALVVIAALIRVGMASRPPPAPAAAPAGTPPAAASPPGALTEREGVMFDWSQESQPGETTYLAGGLQLTLSSQAGDLPEPQLRVTEPGAGAILVKGVAGFATAKAKLGVGRIDQASPVPQVIFATYSGGAHCCTAVTLLERLGRNWRETMVANVDGDGLEDFPKDVAGDGEVEFQFVDQAFLYAFASYAQSLAPPTLLTVHNGAVTDVSAQPRFHKVFEAYLDAPRQDCVTNHNNGACAAFVAAAARLGKADEAWPTMLGAYDHASSWSLPSACRAATPLCPAGQEVTFATFPEALRWFLGQNGYLPKIYLAPADATGPSFSCDHVSGQVLRLICAVPELARADRERAELFGRALALSPDPASMRAAEQQFVRTRNAAPPDAFTLLRLYQAHIAALQAGLAG